MTRLWGGNEVKINNCVLLYINYFCIYFNETLYIQKYLCKSNFLYTEIINFKSKFDGPFPCNA